MCRCAERRAVISRSAAAFVRGDLDMAQVREAASVVRSTAAQDMRDLASRLRMSQARASLRR